MFLHKQGFPTNELRSGMFSIEILSALSGVQSSGDLWGDYLIAHPYQILVLSSGVWWSLSLDIRCLWRHNITTYSHLQNNILMKFVDTTCILLCTHFPL